MTDERACTATTLRGARCSRPALADATVCLAHLPPSARLARGFGGAQPGAGRPRNPRTIDVLREKVEAEADAIMAAYTDTLKKAQKPILVGLGMGEQRIEWVDDLGARMAAADRLLDRAYGRPKQTVEADVRPRSSIDATKLTPAERETLLALIDKARNPDAA